MRVLAIGLAILSGVVFSSPETAMDAAACTTKSDCPQISCYTIHACIAEKCQYKQLPAWTKCPKKGCSNGGDCGDDPNDYCDTKGVFRDNGTCPPNKPQNAGRFCSGNSNGDVCDDRDTCDGNGNCIDKFKRNTVVCQTPTSLDSKTYYCTGSQGSYPVTSQAIFQDIETTMLASKYFTPDMPAVALFVIASTMMITGVGYILVQNYRRSNEDAYTAL
ncbi:hypothetical protein THRCLA_08287 [Thraustotheca clavata]|uniref:Secreted protein n=1 Tax=Thraustotheca clavata TaxID=74557 RepID=A0A1V9Z807_9STRA|nr:hypothetical protein THRCLA_08287 [Thraustotheca clavata]